MKLTKLTPIALATLMSFSAVAEEAEAEKSWKFDASLGFIITSGNNETTTLKGKLEFFKDYEQFDSKYIFDGFYKEDEVVLDDGRKDKQKTAEKYLASSLFNYKLATEGSSLFLAASHEEDKFGAYDSSTNLAVGYGQELFKSDVALLKGYIGPGYVWRDLSDGTSDDSLIAHATADFDYKFNDYVEFSQALSLQPSFEGEKNIKTKSISGLTAKMNEQLKMKFELIATHNSEVPAGTEEMDLETVVTLVYSY